VVKDDVINHFETIIEEAFRLEEKTFSKDVFRQIVKDAYLQVLSYLWTDHIDAMDYLKQSISLQGYAQIDPLTAYKQEAFAMFDRFINTVEYEFVRRIFYVQKVDIQEPLMVENIQNGEDILNESSNPSQKKLGRNDLCFCGSMKKFKNCHGKNS
jgi:preprotein translocase subunit SecA